MKKVCFRRDFFQSSAEKITLGKKKTEITDSSLEYEFEDVTEDNFYKENDILHSIIELTNSNELYNEGVIMKNCVSSYVYKCIDGNSHIFSYANKKRKDSTYRKIATIEVNSRYGIVQVREKTNRSPSKQTAKIIRSWANKTGINIAIPLIK